MVEGLAKTGMLGFGLMAVSSIDLLVFGPHPDDIEIGLGGTVARHVDAGHRVVLCDLTVGELSTNGTPEERLAEGRRAAEVLGVESRENLRWPDGGMTPTAELLRSAVDMVRRLRPRAIAIPYWDDRHPDHVTSSEVLGKAIFKSGLRRYDTGVEAWRPEWVCYYFINDSVVPSFVVDVSDVYERKQRALDCYRSQFAPSDADARPSRLTAPTFRRLIESRDMQWGALAGVAYAEGVIVREPVARSGLLKHSP
jgi:bacillithiol biosynthesis deacetylase BshB1